MKRNLFKTSIVSILVLLFSGIVFILILAGQISPAYRTGKFYLYTEPDAPSNYQEMILLTKDGGNSEFTDEWTISLNDGSFYTPIDTKRGLHLKLSGKIEALLDTTSPLLPLKGVATSEDEYDSYVNNIIADAQEKRELMLVNLSASAKSNVSDIQTVYLNGVSLVMFTSKEICYVIPEYCTRERTPIIGKCLVYYTENKELVSELYDFIEKFCSKYSKYS